MKKLGLILVASMFAAVLVAMSTSSSHATPVFKKQFEEKYPALKSVTDEQKCNVCHYGKTKKNKNDYGKALGELLKKDNYKDALKIACIIPADDELYGVAVKKGNKETLELINKGLAAVTAKGLDKEILKKWLGTAD